MIIKISAKHSHRICRTWFKIFRFCFHDVSRFNVGDLNTLSGTRVHNAQKMKYVLALDCVVLGIACINCIDPGFFNIVSFMDPRHQVQKFKRGTVFTDYLKEQASVCQ